MGGVSGASGSGAAGVSGGGGGGVTGMEGGAGVPGKVAAEQLAPSEQALTGWSCAVIHRAGGAGIRWTVMLGFAVALAWRGRRRRR
jgi:hypothetical protein